MGNGQKKLISRSVKTKLARVLAMFLVCVLVLSGSGMTVLAEEVGEIIEENASEEVASEDDSEGETSESQSENTEEVSEMSEEELSEDVSEDSSEEGNSEEISEEAGSEEGISEETTEEISEDSEEQEEMTEEADDTENSEEVSDEETDDFVNAKTVASGDWGETMHWILNSEGLLKITQDEGVGMEDGGTCPWLETYADDIVSIYLDATCGTDGKIGIVFSEYSNLKSVTFGDNIDGTCYTTASGMFANCNKLENVKFGDFDTTNIRNMASMFERCSNLKELDLSTFNTSNVTKMTGMFNECSSLAVLNLSSFNTEKVRFMSSMFSGCSSLTELDLSNFDTKEVVWMGFMFDGCSSLTDLDISSFDTSSVTDMMCMFRDCSALTELDFSSFDTSNVTDMTELFDYCSSLTKLDLSNFNTSNVERIFGMFRGCNNLTELKLGNLNTSKVTDMTELFDGCRNLEELDVSTFDTSNVTSMNAMFYGCRSLKRLDVSKFNTSSVESMHEMFYGCRSLTELNVSNFDTSNVEYMKGMFAFCSSLEELDLSQFNTDNVTNMTTMFRDCSSLTELKLETFNTSNVTAMCATFMNCTGVTELDLSMFNTDNVTDMSSMFSGCSSLTELDLSRFNTVNVTNMASMFECCSNLKELDLSTFNTSNVTDMGFMFRNCSSLIVLNLSTFDTAKVEYMPQMFRGCEKITQLDISTFNLSKLYTTYDDSTALYIARRISGFKDLLKDCNSLISVNTPVSLLRNDASLPVVADDEAWVRTDNNEKTSVLPIELSKSITLEKKKGVTPTEVTGVFLSKNALELAVGNLYLLEATIKPDDATNKSVDWISSNINVATVDDSGLVNIIGIGKTVITVKSKGNPEISATCTVTVAGSDEMEGLAEGLDVTIKASQNSLDEHILILNESYVPILTWSDGEPWPNVTYTVSNDTAEVVDGKLVAKKAGSGTLTVTASNSVGEGPSATLAYHVYSEKVAGITLNETKVILDAQSEKNSVLLKADIKNSDVAYGKVVFTSNKNDIVSIVEHGDNTATVTLLDATTGNVVITATALDGSGKTASCTIVSGTLADSITVNAPLDSYEDGSYIMNAGKTAKLTAGILPSGATSKTVTWSSSMESVATVDSKGVVTGLLPGKTVITATATDGSGVTGSCVIIVSKPAEEVLLTLEGGTDGKVALYNPEDGVTFKVNASLVGEDGTTNGILQDVNYTVSGAGAKNVTYLGDGTFNATAAGVVTVTVAAKDGSKKKASMKIAIEQHVYDMAVDAPKNIGSYQAEDGMHWIVYKGSKEVNLTPVVTYNGGEKSYQPAKAYANYTVSFNVNAIGKLATGKNGSIVVFKNTAPGTYGITLCNEEAQMDIPVWIDVVTAEEAYIQTVDITLPKNVKSQAEVQSFAVGSKIKLAGILNNGVATKGYTMKWEVSGAESNQGTASVTAAGVLDLTKASANDSYDVKLTISKDEEYKSTILKVKATAKTDAAAMKLVLADDSATELPGSFNVQYVNNGKVYKVAEQSGTANLYSVSGGKKGILSVKEVDGGYIILAEGAGSAKLTITALDGSNAKKAITVKVVNADNPVSKVATGSKSYYVENDSPIRIPYNLVTKNGELPTDSRIRWTVSSESILKVSAGTKEEAQGSVITNAAKGYLLLVPATDMTGKVTVTGTALDGSKKSVKVTVNVVRASQKAVTYSLSLRTPVKTPNGGVPGLALLTYGKSLKLQTNLVPNKAKNKTVNYTIEGVTSNGTVTLSQNELKTKGITVSKGTVKVAKNCTYTGFVKVTASMDYMDYIEGKISASKMLYVQPAVSKVEIVDPYGEPIKNITENAGSGYVLRVKLTSSGELTYDNVSWSVSDSKLASITPDGVVTIKSTATKGKKIKVTATALDGSKKKATITIIVQ